MDATNTQKKNSLPSTIEAVALQNGVPDSISDGLLLSGAGPLAFAVSMAAAGVGIVAALVKRYQPNLLKKIPVVDKVFHNMRTTQHCDTFVNLVGAAAAIASGQYLIALTGLAGAAANPPELAGIRHHDDHDYMKDASILKLILRREDFWNGLNYGLGTILIGGLSVATMSLLPFIGLAVIIGLKNARHHLPERTNHPKMIIGAAFLAAGITGFFTGGSLLLGLASVIGAFNFIANEVQVTPGGFKQVMKDCLTLDNYKYGLVPFVKSGFGLKKFVKNPKLIGPAAGNAVAGTLKGCLTGARNGFGLRTLAKSMRRKKNHAPLNAVSAAVGALTAEGIYIGRSKDNDGVERDYFAAPEDAKDSQGKRLSLNFNQAAAYAAESKVLGHSDWMLPTSVPNKHDKNNRAPDVLGALFKNRNTGAFEGTFDKAWYWSSTTKPFTELDQDSATIQRFSRRGRHSYGYKKDRLSVRLVRSVVAGT